MDHDSPPSSPQPPPSSPFRASQSSPLTRSSPPKRSESSSSSEFDESSQNVKRKRYTYNNPEVPDSDIYWPPADPTNQENRNESGEYDGDLGDQDNEGNVNDWEAHTEQSIDNNQGNEGGDLGDQDNEGNVNDWEERTEQPIEGNQGNEGDEDHRVLTDTSSESSSSDESGDSDSSSEASIQESIQSSRGDDNCETSDSEGYSSDDDISESVSPKIYDGCDLTVEEGVLSIMLLFIKHKLSKVQVGGILKCILKFFLKVFTFPRTQYALFKYVEDLSPVSKERVHYYCSICKYYLGECDGKCTLCGGASHKFFQLPLADQIKNLFENHGLADILDKHEREKQAAGVADNVYSDICDGSEFKRSKIDAPYSLTFLGHTDGLSISESSSVSAWPVEYVIVEIPPNLRYRYVLVSGIYIDEHKPYFNSILNPFADELQTLSKEGVKWKHPKTNIEHVTFVSVPQFVVDAPVRASLQNIRCPGGKHCCNVCEQKMKRLPSEPVLPGKKKKKRRRVYTFEEHESQLRTEQRMNAQGRETRRREKAAGKEVEPTKGVMGNSILKKFPGCDRSTVVFPEYMHVLICVIKLFFKLWFLKDGPWSLKSKRDQIDEFLLRVRVPDYVTRIPRTTDGFSNWKANELRSFVLFYSPVIFKECMEHKYYDHWMLLVLSLYLLLQTKVTLADITKAGVMLRLFCRDFVTLYKVDFFTYYIHNLIHLPLVVMRSGPLWSNSAFQFESFNGLLKKLIHGTKNQAQELVNNVRLAFGIEFLQHRINAAKSSSFQQCKPLVELKSVVRDYRFLDNEKFLLSKFKHLTVYYRAKIKNEVYTSEIYVRQVRRNNFTICYENSNKEKVYGTIKCFLEASSEGSPPLKCALVNKFKIEHLRSLGHTESNQVLPYMIPIADTSSTELINLDQILFKVIRVENYVCLRPNTYEVNL